MNPTAHASVVEEKERRSGLVAACKCALTGRPHEEAHGEGSTLFFFTCCRSLVLTGGGEHENLREAERKWVAGHKERKQSLFFIPLIFRFWVSLRSGCRAWVIV